MAILISFVFLFPLALASVNGNCSYSSCASNMKSYYYYYRADPIPFPFRTPDEPVSCGLPGFDLSCNNSNRTPLLSFPSGQLFNVLSISNSSNYMDITDPQGCLPQKLMQFNSSGTPFYFNGFTNLSFYSCPLSFRLTYGCYEVDCLRGQNRSVVCTTQATSSSSLHNECAFVGDANVPGAWTAYGFSTAHSAELRWDTPEQCRRCQYEGQDCRRDPHDSTLIKCFARPSSQWTQPKTKTNAGVVTIVLAAMGLPILFGVVCLCCIRCIKSQRNNRGVRVSSNVVDVTVGQNHVEAMRSTNCRGVEQATLDRYPIVVVGESGRILMCMEDKICPICLSEYEPRDTIKSLPECLHRFHSDCIDEWLHTKAICPVCRTMPLRISS